MSYDRFVELSKITPLQEGKIPFGTVMVLIDGKWEVMSEDQYMRYKANDPNYIKKNKFAKKWLKETEKESDKDCTIKACAECLFCYFVESKDGTISHWSCTMDNRLRTKDILKRHEKCPIK